MNQAFIWFLAVFTLVGLVMVAYLLLARPYQLRWGATDEEVKRPMPGDELDPHPTFLATRAITIEGTPEEIWPWLLQMGYGRAGFYGYDILENLGSPRGKKSADRILPEIQHFKVGDEVPISAAATEVFYAIEPNQYLIWAGQTGQHPGGFTWALYPIDGQHTRLVSRIRWSYHAITQPWPLSLDIFTEFTDHLAVRKILQGVKGRVEGHSESMMVTNLEFVTYIISALVFLVALLLNLVRPFAWPGWLAGLAAGAGWLLTWYAPIPFWGGVLLEIMVLTW
jgi:hypothetical protein